MQFRNNSLLIVLILLASASLISCSEVSESKTVVNNPVLSENDAIAEATLRCLLYDDLKDYFTDDTQKRFVQVAGNDPSDALLSYFSDYRFPLYKSSGCDDTFDGIIDKETGSIAILYRLDAPMLIDKTNAEVHFGLRSDGWGGMMSYFTLEKIDGIWTVTGQGEILKA